MGAAGLPRCCAPRSDRVLRQAQDERGVRPHPSPLPSRGRGCPSTGLRMNRGRWAQRDCRVAAPLGMTGSFDRLRTNGGSPSPQPSPIKGEGMSFDGLRMNGGFALTPALSHRGRGDVLRRAQDERGRVSVFAEKGSRHAQNLFPNNGPNVGYCCSHRCGVPSNDLHADALAVR